MQLNKYEKREAELRALEKESREVSKHTEVWIDVEPYRWGWDVYPDLRDDAKNRVDAPLMMEILNMFCKPYHTTNVNLVRAIRNGDDKYKVRAMSKRQKRKYEARARRNEEYRKMLMKMGLAPRNRMEYYGNWHGYNTSEVHWHIPRVPDISKEYRDMLPVRLQHFFKYSILNRLNPSPDGKEIYSCTIPSYYYRARTKAHWVTQHRVPDGDALSLESWLDDRALMFRRTVVGYTGWRGRYIMFINDSSLRAQTRNKIREFVKEHRNLKKWWVSMYEEEKDIEITPKLDYYD